MNDEYLKPLKTRQVCKDGVWEIMDQTVGCNTCGMECWNYPGMKEAGLTCDEYEDLFLKLHPYYIDDEHDPGDEDRWGPYGESPVGGWDHWFIMKWYGNSPEAHERFKLYARSHERKIEAPAAVHD